MLRTDKPELRNVTGISDEETNLIKAFMQGAVYGWIKSHPGEWFAVRDLVGGENWDWAGTPLYALFEKHKNDGKSDDEAFDVAAQDLGWLVKTALSEDKRTFESRESGLVRNYRWIV
ncbi:MAG: hypothetical protein WC721_18170 [Victivallaceae bacterium]|jgi:hypothetical protein